MGEGGPALGWSLLSLRADNETAGGEMPPVGCCVGLPALNTGNEAGADNSNSAKVKAAP